MTQGLSLKLMSVLESSLSKLARYDEGSLIGSILSFTNVSSSGKDIGQGYVNFLRNNMDQIRGKIGDDLWTLNFFEQWYTQQINMLCNWLSDRLDHSLHFAQVTSLTHIIKVSMQKMGNSACGIAHLIVFHSFRKSIPILSYKVFWRRS